MFDVLVGDIGIFLAVALVTLAIARANRVTLNDMLYDPSPIFRRLSRLSIGAISVFPIWVTLFDNWRQVIGIPTEYLQNRKMSYASDPFISEPTSDYLRAVTWVLFILAVVGGAYLYARYARGLWAAVLISIGSLASFFIVNTFRLRFDVDSVRITDTTINGPAEIVSVLFWVAGLLVTFVILIYLMYFMVWGPVAIVFKIIYHFTIGRAEAKEIQAEAAIFRKLSERASASRGARNNSV